ncbi:isopenicillin N synthase family oxygenase [Baekduia soli]|uniref:Isopenicillin N synthase family oxygenase n=1 Tax=Baekduia soli TaxID=496014 RepID=A0A5B8U9J7_9ACTN|nr:2-oxoglutarate and iron-dependent oxygenase domain-containing protein [Baekduia soli]QEC49744.1 isopenicillin N synthase family oxygenase [Baekduia soli]
MVPDAPLPVLDLSGFAADPGGPQGRAFVVALQQAFHRNGAIYLEGHGVPDGVTSGVRAAAAAFFALPEDERLAIENVHSPQFRGYTRLGNERTNGLRDLRDQVDIGRELPAPVLGAGDPAWMRLRGPNLWPAGLPGFRPAVMDYIAALEAVGHVLIRAVALALGQPAGHFDALVDPPEILAKIIRYPAATGALQTDQGVGSHTDGGLLTFLDQDEVGGLQALVDGAWVDVPARPGAFVVNIGELLQLVSQGLFRATVHRVVSPPAGVERLSVAYFFNPRFDARVEPVTLPPELAAQAPGGQSTDAGNPILANYGDNSLKVRLRAHPDVAARHHADLLAGPR